MAIRFFLLKSVIALCGAALLVAAFSVQVAHAQACDNPPTACISCQMDPEKPMFCPTVPCVATVPGGSAAGMCVLPCKCNPTSFTGQSGQQQGIGDLKGMMDMLKGVMDALKGGGGGGGGGGEQPQQGQQGCTSTYQVSVPTGDPCAIYVAPTSDSLLGGGSGASSLLDALNGGGGSSISDQLSNAFNEPNTTQTTSQQTETTDTTTSATNNLGGQSVNLQGGAQGDIRLIPSGATIIANTRDTEANTEVAGFYGSTISGEQPQGIAARMCQSRPWSNEIVSFLIPPTFFDSICSWRGYPVGTPPPPPQQQVVVVQQAPAAPAAQEPEDAEPVVDIQPEVDIWAVPASVSLGQRTSIFWNTKDVESCIISSPDGSFEEHTLSGGAATVPLSGPTVFTISCLTVNGDPITDQTTVQISI